ncbi:MAG: hypothetical protein AAB074_16370 [Planctomycetota bacterium]
MSRDTEIRRAKDQLAKGDAAGAERALSASLASGGAAADALKARAMARAGQGNWGGAAEDLERVLKAAPDEASPLEIEYIRVLHLAQSLPEDQARRAVESFSYEKLAASVLLSCRDRSYSIDDFATRSVKIATEKYAAAPPENLKHYLSAKIPGRLYRAPALQSLPAMDAWARCEWWVHHGLGAADVVHEAVTGDNALAAQPALPNPPFRYGSDPADLGKRCPVDWGFVHHALLVMVYDLADELAEEQAQLRTEMPGIRDAAVKPLVYLGFGIGLESQGI